jgi:hypothetical protein
MRIANLIALAWIAVLSAMLWRLPQVPDAAVYRLSRTADGELGVYCANGADATVRPSGDFGYIVVSCGR